MGLQLAKPKVTERLLERHPRTLRKLRWWVDDENWQAIEEAHDFVQVLFPLTEPGKANRDLVLTERDVRYLQQDKEFLKHSLIALHCMYKFFGLKATPDGMVIEHKRRFYTFFVTSQHNHLRITRMLKFMRLMGLKKSHARFRTFCVQAARDMKLPSLRYWKTA